MKKILADLENHKMRPDHRPYHAIYRAMAHLEYSKDHHNGEKEFSAADVLTLLRLIVKELEGDEVLD